MRILAIETSCDETAIAIAEFSGTKAHPRIRALSHIVSSQVRLHAKFGGVVPNLARREHQRNLVPILLEALKGVGENDLGFKNHDLRKGTYVHTLKSKIVNLKSILVRETELLEHVEKHIVPLGVPHIDSIAVTHGPGLAPALWVGVNFARALALLWGKPLIPVNHMAGHIYSALLRITNDELRIMEIKFPALALLVSGGHTELVLMRGHGKYQILGETLDDAAGEAFDKVARLLGLPYPGGPAISALAEQSVAPSLHGITFPRPMLHSKDYDFSFSGLKTAVFYKVRELSKAYSIKKLQPVIAKEFQDATVEVLVRKTIRAAKEYKAKTILLGGGVAANGKLRKNLGRAVKKELPSAHSIMPDLSMTGDNALMIALAAYVSGKKAKPADIQADANLRL